MIRDYYTLTKPGIIRGNAITAVAGFLLAARGRIDGWLLTAMLVGLSLVIASACVFNNYIDRDVDRRMARTRSRPLVRGVISGPRALAYGTGLGVVGALVLGVGTNALAVGLALVGFVVYVVLYGIGKRRSPWGTVVGSIAGAVPPVVGYCAVTNRLDVGAAVLALMLVLWQMPHFYAIAMYRLDDYAAAKLPVLPVVKGLKATKVQMLWYVAAFTLVAPLLTVLGLAGYTYALVVVGLGLAWLGLGLRGFGVRDDRSWARGMFGFSLVVMMAVSVALMVGAVLP